MIYKSRNIYQIILLPLLLILLMTPLHSQRTKSSLSAGEQRYAEKGLKDNRYFFYFINSSVSNLGSDEEKKIFKEAIQRDLIAQILYMKFSFHDSFVEIKHAQKLLIDLYKKTLQNDIDTTMKLLHSFAPEVVKKKSKKARHYLSLGYRDVAIARQYLLMADNYRQTLFSMRLYKYVRAIKKAKHGKRYAFLSIIETRQMRKSPAAIKLQIRQLYKEMHGTSDETKISTLRKEIGLIKEELALAKADLGYLSFDQLASLIERINSGQKDFHSILHHDNYYKTKDEKSYFDQIWDNPQLDEIKEFSQYQMKY